MEKHIVIIGSGIAGLSLAYKLEAANADLRITVITKSNIMEGNTRYAQGGIAAVINSPFDSFASHIKDTLQCGKGLCDPSVVEMVVKQAPERIAELISWGTQFDQTQNNEFELALEGGHSYPRVLHHKDFSGYEIESVLVSKIKQSKKIIVLEQHIALDLIIEEKKGEKFSRGIKILDTNSQKIISIYASKVILANGGCGQVFMNTTNPAVSTGDGYAMAARAGAKMRDMRFMQFHPTALYALQKDTAVSFLISEAVRGFGAYIVNHQGERFIFKHDIRGELATRDIISQAIQEYLIASEEECVFLDIRHLDYELFKIKFPAINKHLETIGCDPSKTYIPIIPAAHYQCGGIQVNQNGETSIANLYAIGEVSATGLHGANRLASNSLLEALVYAHNVSKHILYSLLYTEDLKISTEDTVQKTKTVNHNGLPLFMQEVKKRMSVAAFQKDKFLLIKDRDHLSEMYLKIEHLIAQKKYSRELIELRNILETAILILQDKIESKNTIGLNRLTI